MRLISRGNALFFRCHLGGSLIRDLRQGHRSAGTSLRLLLLLLAGSKQHPGHYGRSHRIKQLAFLSMRSDFHKTLSLYHATDRRARANRGSATALHTCPARRKCRLIQVLPIRCPGNMPPYSSINWNLASRRRAAFKARETGDIPIARRWSTPRGSVGCGTPRRNKKGNWNP